MFDWFTKCFIYLQFKAEKLLKEESGEANMIAILLIIIAVIALAGIFQDQLKGILEGIFGQIRGLLGLPPAQS